MRNDIFLSNVAKNGVIPGSTLERSWLSSHVTKYAV